MSCSFPGCSFNAAANGYCVRHSIYGAPAPTKVRKPIAKISAKKAARKDQDVEMDLVKQAWFANRRMEMTGKCMHCGGKTCKDDGKLFRNSICHILPKSIFKSVALHPLNQVELCFWAPSCHTNMDNGLLMPYDMNCWSIIVERFRIIYPDIAESERKYLPDYLTDQL